MTHATRFCEHTVCWILLAALLALTAFPYPPRVRPFTGRIRRAIYPSPSGSAQRLAGAGSLTACPSTGTPYGPGSCAGGSGVGWAVASRTLIPGRLVSVAAAFLTAVVIVIVVGRRTASAACGLTAGVLYVGYPIIAYWFHDYRVDALACFFAVAAYAARDLPRRGLLASALLVVVGPWSNRLSRWPPSPFLFTCCLSAGRRDALLYLGGVAALGAMTWGALFYLSHGYYFDLGLWGNRRDYLLRKAIQSTQEFAVNPAFIAAAVALIGVSWPNPSRSVPTATSSP